MSTAEKRVRFVPAVLVLTAAAGLVAAGAVVGGRATDRWGVPPDLAERAVAMRDIPTTVGDWTGVDRPIEANSLEVAGVSGYLCRQYTHRFTGEQLTVLVVSGRPGRVAAHPPEMCYAASGYTAGPRHTREVGPNSVCWQADFGRPADTLRIVWGWGTGDRWAASAAPRIEFATAGNLYKMYVIRPATQPDRDDAVLAGFLRSFLPECHRQLTPRTAAPTDR
jgi:Protein of unknown function (DUF3485)